MTLDQRIATRRAALVKQRAERKDPLDLPGAWTLRECLAYNEQTSALDDRIAAFEHAVTAHAALPPLDVERQWRDHLVAWRDTLSAELFTITSPIRSREVKERHDALLFALRLIDRGLGAAKLPIVTLEHSPLGLLMTAAGYDAEAPHGPRGWRGSLDEVEARIRTLTAQHAKAQDALDAVLLDDAARTAHEVEHDAHRAALKTLRVQGNPEGTGLIAYNPETDEPLDPSAMTTEQKAAIKWFEGVVYPPRELITS